MTNSTLTIRSTTSQDAALITKLIENNWGGEPFPLHGELYFPSRLPGFIALSDDEVKGYIFYHIKDQNCKIRECEIIVLQALIQFHGLGTTLINYVTEVAKKAGCSRIFLLTTNDNIDALRFYQKRGFHIYKVEINALEQMRKIRPQLPIYGRYGIEKRDEIYLEMLLENNQ